MKKIVLICIVLMIFICGCSEQKSKDVVEDNIEEKEIVADICIYDEDENLLVTSTEIKKVELEELEKDSYMINALLNDVGIENIRPQFLEGNIFYVYLNGELLVSPQVSEPEGFEGQIGLGIFDKEEAEKIYDEIYSVKGVGVEKHVPERENVIEEKNAIRNKYPDKYLQVYDFMSDYVAQYVSEVSINELVEPAKEDDGYIAYYISFERTEDEYFDERPEISIDYADGEFYSFTMSFDMNEGKNIFKKLVIGAIAATDNISIEKAEEISGKLFNKFDGWEPVTVKTKSNKFTLEQCEWNDEFGTNTTYFEVSKIN